MTAERSNLSDLDSPISTDRKAEIYRVVRAVLDSEDHLQKIEDGDPWKDGTIAALGCEIDGTGAVLPSYGPMGAAHRIRLLSEAIVKQYDTKRSDADEPYAQLISLLIDTLCTGKKRPAGN